MSNMPRIRLNHLLRVALLLMLATLMSACSSGPQVRTNGSETADFGAFNTFSFFNNLSTDRAGYNSMISRQLKASTRREMEVRGLEFVENPAQADLLINFWVDVSSEFRVRDTGQMWTGPSYWHHRRGFYDPWRGHGRWPTHSRVDIQEITRGTLSIDVVERAPNMLLWEGVATRRVTQRTMNDLGPALDDATHRIFREFPVVPRF